MATFVLWYMAFVSADEMSVSKCLKHSSSHTGIFLTCPDNHRIHVIAEVYGNKASDGTCRVSTAASDCFESHTNDTNGLVVNCNGRQSCTELAVSSSISCFPANPAVEIAYECVNGSLDMCEKVLSNTREHSRKPYLMNGSLYFHSPGFPDGVGISGNCTCSIRVRIQSVMIIEHRAGDSVLQLSMKELKSRFWPKEGTTYNRYMNISESWCSSLRCRLELSYNNGGLPHQNVWIRVTGSRRINVKCKGESGLPTPKHAKTRTPVTLTASIRQHPATSTTTEISTSMPEKTTNDYGNTSTVVIASVVCGVIVLLILVTLSVYFKLKKSKRTKKAAKDRNDTTTSNDADVKATCAHYQNVTDAITFKDGGQQGSRDTNNTYSDLSRYENIDGVHEYGKLHVYGNTSSDGKK